MIPSIFVSSTIADLHYLRDGLRDAVEELAYRPVMSEYGEVGYINPTTAAESCYRSVPQCQMVVLILGRRYGSTDEEGYSVTHREYLAAKENNLPIITFVDPQLLSFKEVYDADPKANLWDSFQSMDNPKQTFALLDEINRSESYNAILPFTSVGDAKRKLKQQIADFVGDRLAEVVTPLNREVRDILAEVKTIRNQFMHRASGNDGDSPVKIKRYFAVTRFLLSDAAANYRKLLEHIFADHDEAIEKIGDCDDFAAVLDTANVILEISAEIEGGFRRFQEHRDLPQDQQPIAGAFFGTGGGWYYFQNQRLIISQMAFDHFDEMQRKIHARAIMT